MAPTPSQSPQMTSTCCSNASGKKVYRPLSISGMPKDTRTLCNHRPNPNSGLGFPASTYNAVAALTRSPDPASPSTSTKSSATSIDSEPSTPPYSPRSNCEWESPTLLILQPISSSSEPPSPSEPLWEMMNPPKPSQKTVRSASPHQHSASTHQGPATNPLSCHPVKPPRSRAPSARRAHSISELAQQENRSPYLDQYEDEFRDDQQADKGTGSNAALSPPLGKFTAKMKLMLRRSNTGDKVKAPKKTKGPFEVERMDDTHWTEM